MRIGLVLAAGASRRFGRGDKLLARLGRHSLLNHAVRHARAAGTSRVLVVVPAPAGRVARAVRRLRRVTTVVARDHRAGQGASLRAGLAAIRPCEREAVIFLGDMPGARLVRGQRLTPGIDAVRPVHAGVPGHPLLVRADAARAAAARGDPDRGLIGALDQARVAQVRGGAGAILDVDTVAALGRARRQKRRWT